MMMVPGTYDDGSGFSVGSEDLIGLEILAERFDLKIEDVG